MEFVRQTIEINGCKLSFARGGNGVPLMYLHGTDGLAEWPAILDTLAERFDVIVPDHPGFGASEAPTWIDDVSDVAYCYLDAIEALGLSGVHVVGQSLGGWIALEMAVRSTERLRSLTLISAAGIHVKGVPKTDIFMIDPEEQARLAYVDPQNRPGGRCARRRRQISGSRHSQPHRQRPFRLATALLQPAAGALAASGERAHPRHLGRWRSHHSTGLCRGVPPPDPGINAHHDSQCRPPAARRTGCGRRAGDADLPAELMDAAMERLRWPLRFIMAAVLSLPAGSARAADAALVAAAKNEGEVVWYTTQIISQLVRPVSAAFEKKYGIKVRSTRANSTELSVKIINESRAGKPQSDVFDGTSTVVPLKKEGYVLRWLPDPAEAYPAQYKDPEGYWVANNLFFLTPGFNTSLVAKGAEPRSYQALLAPKWRGKMAWSTTPSNSGGPGFIGTVLTEMGNEKGMAYLRALSQQQIANIGGAAREVLDQVIAGEYVLGLQIFNHHAVISAKKGAPVDWIKMEPATGTLSVISVHRAAPHAHAAKLLVDFIISPEGQHIFRAAEYLPADPAVPALTPSLKPDEGSFRTHFFTPEQTEDGMVTWKKVYDDLFR